jgi:putative ABC transport system permease protein
MILELAWRNSWRQPRRTILSSLAIAFTSAFLIFMPSLQNGSYIAMVENTLRLFDGYAEIQQPGYRDNPEIRNSLKMSDSLISDLKKIRHVETVSQRAISFALLASDQRSFGAQIVGVQSDSEALVSTIPNNIKQGRFLLTDNSNTDEIVLGDVLAKNLKASIGDKITLLGNGRDGSLAADSLTVVGIFSTGISTMDRLMAEIPLQRFQQTFSMSQQVHSIILSGKDISSFQQSIKSIQDIANKNNLTALDWQQLQPGLMKGILLDISTSLPLYVAMVLVVTFSLLNSVFMSVLERTREFGVLLSLGMRPSNIAKMVWIETIILIIFGLLMGIALGYALTEYYAHVGIHFEEAQEIFSEYGLPNAMYPQLNGFTLLIGPGIIGLSILISTIFPVVRIYKMQPVPAMRAV